MTDNAVIFLMVLLVIFLHLLCIKYGKITRREIVKKNPIRVLGLTIISCIMISMVIISNVQATSSPLMKEAEVYQEEAAEICKQAVRLMDGKDFSGAYNLLMENYGSYANDNDTNFLLGQCAYQLKDATSAIKYYQNILNKDPNLPRVRLELGKAYVAAGQMSEAKKEFNWVLGTSPPPTVAEHVRQFIALLESQKKVNIKVSAGYRYDSNVNAGLEDIINYNGWRVDLRKKTDTAALAAVNVDLIEELSSGSAWQTSLSNTGTKYFDRKDYNVDEWSVYTGVVKKDKKKVLYIPLAARKIDVGSESYSTSIGLAPQLQLQLSPNRLLFVSLSAMRQKYQTASERDGNQWSFNVAERVNHAKVSGSFFEFGLGYTQETASNINFASDSYSARFTYYTPIGNGFNLMVQPGITWKNYQGADSMSQFILNQSSYRRDVMSSFHINLSKTIKSWNYSLSYNYHNNNSNLTLYPYDRTLINLQVSKNL